MLRRIVSLSEISNILKKIFSPEFLFKSQLSLQSQKSILIISGALLVLAILIKLFSFFKFKKDKIRQKLYDKIFVWFLTIAILSFFFLFCSWQQIGFLAMSFWQALLGLIFLVWGIILLIYKIKKFPKELVDFEYLKRKEKYLPKPKR